MKRCVLFLLALPATILTYSQTTAVKGPPEAMAFTFINNRVAPTFAIVGKYETGKPLYILDHYNRITYTMQTTVFKTLTPNLVPYDVTLPDKSPYEPIYGMNTVIVNPAEGAVLFLVADTVTDRSVIESFAKLLEENNSIEKKFRNSPVAESSLEYKKEMEADSRTMLKDRSFAVFTFRSGEKEVTIAKFPNAVFLKTGNKFIYTTSLTDNYIINGFTIGDRMFIDLPGYMGNDPGYPKCENWNSRILEILPGDIVEKSFTCY